MERMKSATAVHHKVMIHTTISGKLEASELPFYRILYRILNVIPVKYFLAFLHDHQSVTNITPLDILCYPSLDFESREGNQI